THARLSCSSHFVITAFKLNSAPVPAMVTIEPYGKPSVARTFLLKISHTFSSVLAPTTIAFVQSITLPPPTAKTKSILCSLHKSIPFCTVVRRGLGSTPGSSTHSIEFSFNKFVTSPYTPFLFVIYLFDLYHTITSSDYST